MYTNASCTIFNTYKQDNKTYYQKVFLPFVYWEVTTIISSNISNVTRIEELTLLIPKDIDIENRSYLTPKNFDAVDDKSSYWTLKKGDRIVRGNVEESFTSISELDKKYDDVVSIVNVSLKDFGSEHMRHWEVKGA